MADDSASSHLASNDKNASTFNPARPDTTSKSRESNDGSFRPEHTYMQEGDGNRQPVADFRFLPLVLVPTSGNEVSAVERERNRNRTKSSENINTNRVNENARDTSLVPIDNPRNVSALAPVLKAPMLIPQNLNANDTLNAMAHMMKVGIQHLSLQMQSLALTVEQTNGTVTEVLKNQTQTRNQLDVLNTAVEEIQNKLQGMDERFDNLEGFVNGLSDDLQNYLRRIDQLPVQEQPVGPLVIIGPNNENIPLWAALLAMPRYQQFLVVLGVIGISYISWRVALWAYPYIAEAVPAICLRISGLPDTAAQYLEKVNWDEFFRRFANMGRDGGFNFTQFMNDPIARQMADCMFGRNILVFIGTLIEVIRQRYGDDFKAQ
ncbi:unnamed protein product [Orchesella dallaii]|uniref:Uncharacterized protein n=1 Tax=Orchesella dallaii TaxID=48710 RepID=A0ABP1S675_9HEXA